MAELLTKNAPRPAKLTKRVLDAAKPKADRYFVWCGALPGFGVRIYPTGRKVFVAQVRVRRRTRRVTIGNFGPYTVDQARERAEEIIRGAAEGRDPQHEKQEAKRALTVAELCDEYLEAARAGRVITRFQQPKSSSTVAIDEGRIARHIKPLIGRIPARDLRRTDVQRMVDSIAAGKTAVVVKTKLRGRAVVTGGAGTAARVVQLLGGIYSWGQKRGLTPDGQNPVRGVEKVRGRAKDRVLSPTELRSLGKVLEDRKGEVPSPVVATRLIALTGLRRDEAFCLKWREVDELGQCLRLESTKTGRSTRPIGKPALELLRSLPRRDGVEWVFPRADGKAPAQMKKRVAELFDAAGLTDARSHDLRRTFASVAADSGFGEATIAEMLGHARRGVTERHYVRRSDPALLAAADNVAAQIAAALATSPRNAEVQPLRTQHGSRGAIN